MSVAGRDGNPTAEDVRTLSKTGREGNTGERFYGELARAGVSTSVLLTQRN